MNFNNSQSVTYDFIASLCLILKPDDAYHSLRAVSHSP